eukprot:356430-Chlamydomonas_euryale.AAC.6
MALWGAAWQGTYPASSSLLTPGMLTPGMLTPGMLTPNMLTPGMLHRPSPYALGGCTSQA